jgi:hypothetical protein
MTPSALEGVAQQLTNFLNNTMAMVSEYVSHAVATLDSPEDLRSAIGLAERLLDTLKAVYPPENGLDTATRPMKPHNTYATTARDAATTDTPPAGQPLPGSQQKKPKCKPNSHSSSSKHDEGKLTTQLILHFPNPSQIILTCTLFVRLSMLCYPPT